MGAFDQRFFCSTRGRIVLLLRRQRATVTELAERLELTDNAVRAHLLALERDGLVRQSGIRRGRRKPHYAYELTPEAERLFPKAYDELLNELLSKLKGRISAEALGEALSEVGRSLAARWTREDSSSEGASIEERARRVLEMIELLGGVAELRAEADGWVIDSRICPFAAVVSQHPEVCRVVASLVAEAIGEGYRVYGGCDRVEWPHCWFKLAERRAGG
jgi:predicted ArsR family transcriptional regulator